MFSVSADTTDLEKSISGLPALLARVASSGRGSLGFYVADRMKKHIETDGAGVWPMAHPLTRTRKRKGGKWVQRRKYSPLGVFRGFIRYGVRKGEVTAGFTKKKTAELGTDNAMIPAVLRFERGAERPVTPKMRRLLGAGRKNAKSKPGVDFFPLRKETVSLSVPARPVLMPVLRKENPKLPEVLDRKIQESIDRNEEKYL